jgi:pimeloyl-ACP methyl ester carboxylesterase
MSRLVPVLLRVCAFALPALLVVTPAACTSNAQSPQARERLTRTLPVPDCADVACDGELGGARYRIRLPETWNGTLLLYSHGYRSAEPSPPDFRPGATDAPVASTDETADALLARGYALAGSSYARNGWAVQDGVAADEELYRYFAAKIGRPDRLYVWGDSLGGLITQTFAEKHPEWVSGAAPMCGVLAGLNLNFDLSLDLSYTVKTLLYPQMKLTGFASHAEAVAVYTAARDRVLAATKTPAGIAKVLMAAALLDAPAQTVRFDGADTVSRVSAAVEGVLTGLGYSTFARYEIEQRVGGNPSGNVGTDYARRVTRAERALIDTVSPGSTRRLLDALAVAPRVSPVAAAREKADGLGNPTGVLKDPTVTLHTAADPLVLVQNETVFGDRVAAAKGRSADLVQLYTVAPARYRAPAPYGAGHCRFTTDERVGLVTVLDDWVRGGVYPGPVSVAAAMRGAKGYSPLFTPGRWPADLAG